MNGRIYTRPLHSYLFRWLTRGKERERRKGRKKKYRLGYKSMWLFLAVQAPQYFRLSPFFDLRFIQVWEPFLAVVDAFNAHSLILFCKRAAFFFISLSLPSCLPFLSFEQIIRLSSSSEVDLKERKKKELWDGFHASLQGTLTARIWQRTGGEEKCQWRGGKVRHSSSRERE